MKNLKIQTSKELEEAFSAYVRAMKGHDVFTPFYLVDEILDLTFAQIGGNKEELKIAVLFNTEFVLALLMKHDIPAKNITLFGDDDPARKTLADGWGVAYHDAYELLNDDTPFNDRKFDVVVGNPPYQKGTHAKGGAGHSAWDAFVDFTITKLAKRDGHIALIHPSHWRNIGGDHKRIGNLLKKINMHFLAINNIDDGMKTFGKATRFDYYVAEMSHDPDLKTKIRDETSKVVFLNIKKRDFVPNFDYDFVDSIIAKKGEEKVDLIYERTMYGTDKSHMSKEKTKLHKFPCVYYVHLPDETKLDFWYSSIKKGMFGKPKVMFGTGIGVGGIYADVKGEYGMCNNTAGIVDKPENLENIRVALKSAKFKKLMQALQFTTQQYNKRIISEFRKDFWKEFI